MKLEELLNTLCEKGWKPFGDERIVPYVKIDCRQIALISFYKLCDDGMHQWLFDTDIRTVLSKESNLWQFVCENKMIKKPQEGKLIEIYDNSRCETEGLYDDLKYEYRLIESSLKDESELEQFLLDNIKV